MQQSDSEGDSAEKTASIVLTFLHVKRGKEEKRNSVLHSTYPEIPRANLPQKKNGRDEILRDLRPRAM
jgi:hypothetical protein